MEERRERRSGEVSRKGTSLRFPRREEGGAGVTWCWRGLGKSGQLGGGHRPWA